MDVNDLYTTVSTRAFAMGANMCKIADLAEAHDFITTQYGTFFTQFPRAVSIAVYFPKEIVQQQLEGPTRSYNYFYHTINRQLDTISLAVSGVIQNAGYRAYPVPASDYREAYQAEGLQYRVAEEDPEKIPAIPVELYGAFGHRLAANLSGIGWVGKSCSIINPDVGPRLRLTTILTDAPFEPDKPLSNRCGSCTRCSDACPAGALSGTLFQPGQPVEERLNRDGCNAHLSKIKSVFGQGTCALCLAVCPWGNPNKKA